MQNIAEPNFTSNLKLGNDWGKTIIVRRFIGATPESIEIETLLEGICQEITTILQIDLPYKDFIHLPKMQLSMEEHEQHEHGLYDKTPRCRQLFTMFRSILASIPKDLTLVLWLDALDQLNPSNNSHALFWLPCNLKENVRVVLSILSGEDAGLCINSAESKIPSSNIRSLPALSVEYAYSLLMKWLQAAHRSLQTTQQEHIIANFKNCQIPMYLKLAFEEARYWKSYDTLPTFPDGRQGLAKDMDGIICDTLSRLKKPENHGEVLVSRALAYLSASRKGLSEDEMIDVLSRDAEVMSDLRCRSSNSPEVNQLPASVWCRLHSDLEPYLIEHRSEHVPLLSLWSRQVGIVSVRELDKLGKIGIHAKLAAYFEEHLSLFEAESILRSREVFELLWQHCQAGNWNRLYDLLIQLTLPNTGVLTPKSPVAISETDFWRYWTCIETNTQLRLVNALHPIIERPEDYSNDILSFVSSILIDRRQLKQAGRILTYWKGKLRKDGDLRTLAAILGLLASVHYFEHQMDEALSILDEEEAICLRLAERKLQASCLIQRAVVLESLGLTHQALRIYEEQESIFRSLNDFVGISICLNNRAIIASKFGKLSLAMELLQECELIELGADDEIAYARTLYNQGIVLRRLNMLHVAERVFLKSETISKDIGNMEGVSGCLGNRAAILEDIGRPRTLSPS